MPSWATRPPLRLLGARETYLVFIGLLLLLAGALNDALSPAWSHAATNGVFNYLTPVRGCALLVASWHGAAIAQTRTRQRLAATTLADRDPMPKRLSAQEAGALPPR